MEPLECELNQFVASKDLSPRSVKALRSDLRKFCRWFQNANGESFDPGRVTVRDVADFRDHLFNTQRQCVATVNRAVVSVRSFLGHLVQTGVLPANPAKAVKEMRRVKTVPKGLSNSQVRRIMREVELRGDVRAGAILGVMLHGGLRVGDVVGLTLADVEIGPKSGTLLCRRGKGRKQRVVPLSVEGRRLLGAWLAVRPPVDSSRVFIGERGPLTEDGVRSLCSKYAALSGIAFSPHTLRHTFAHRFLAESQNDLVALAQILGHENLNTTAMYTGRSDSELQEKVEQLRFE